MKTLENFEPVGKQEIIKKACEAKANAVFAAITEGGAYKVNSPRVDSRLEKATTEIIGKHQLEQSEGMRQAISFGLMKAALERIALDMGGNLRLDKELEDKYCETLLLESILDSASNREEVVALVKRLDKNNILDSNRQGRLIDDVLANKNKT